MTACVPLIYITQCYLMKAIFVTNVFGEYGSNKTRSTVRENGFLLFGKTLYGREWPVYGKHKFWKDHTFWSPAVVFPILVQFFSDALASLALMVVTDWRADWLIETGDWQFCMFDSSRTTPLVFYPMGIFVWSPRSVWSFCVIYIF